MAEQGWAGEEGDLQKAPGVCRRRCLLSGLSAGGLLALSSLCLRLEKRGRGLVECHK